MIYQVNYLLSMSRLPDHFYALVNDVTGRDAVYQNPGVALRSWIIANCIRLELVNPDASVLELIRECETFSTSPENISKIMNKLEERSSGIIANIFESKMDKMSQDIVKLVQSLQEAVKVTKMKHESFIMVQESDKNHVDITSKPGMVLVTEFINLSSLISEASFLIERFTPRTTV